jgi:PAS domain-containing protein
MTADPNFEAQIVELKEKLREAQSLEETFHALFETMHEGVALHELVYDDAGKAVDYRILDINPSYESILSMDRKMVAGRKATELYGEAGLIRLDTFVEVVETGEPIHFEEHFGTESTYRLTVFSLPNNRFGVIFQDISIFKQTEMALEESEKRYRLITDSVTDIISMASMDGAYEYVSPACRTVLGYEPEDLIGRSYAEFVHPDHLSAPDAPASDLPDTFVSNYRVRHKEGH